MLSGWKMTLFTFRLQCQTILWFFSYIRNVKWNRVNVCNIVYRQAYAYSLYHSYHVQSINTKTTEKNVCKPKLSLCRVDKLHFTHVFFSLSEWPHKVNNVCKRCSLCTLLSLFFNCHSDLTLSPILSCEHALCVSVPFTW